MQKPREKTPSFYQIKPLRGFLNTVEEDFLFLFVLNYVNFSIAAADVSEACMGVHGYRDGAPL